MAAPKDTLVIPDDPESVVLELDEMWSLVRSKARKRWIWLALCRQTRQVVACVIGGRSEATCQQLWRSIPDGYRQGVCYSDFWKAYRAIIPDEQHVAVGKDTGSTAHIAGPRGPGVARPYAVERFNGTIRQRTGPVGDASHRWLIAVMSKIALSPLR